MYAIHLPSGEMCANQSAVSGPCDIISWPSPFAFIRQIRINPLRSELK